MIPMYLENLVLGLNKHLRERQICWRNKIYRHQYGAIEMSNDAYLLDNHDSTFRHSNNILLTIFGFFFIPRFNKMLVNICLADADIKD